MSKKLYSFIVLSVFMMIFSNVNVFAACNHNWVAAPGKSTYKNVNTGPTLSVRNIYPQHEISSNQQCTRCKAKRVNKTKAYCSVDGEGTRTEKGNKKYHKSTGTCRYCGKKVTFNVVEHKNHGLTYIRNYKDKTYHSVQEYCKTCRQTIDEYKAKHTFKTLNKKQKKCMGCNAVFSK